MKVIVLAYGRGGHQEQIRRLATLLSESSSEPLHFLCITDSNSVISDLNNVISYYRFNEVRDKYSASKTVFNFLPLVLKQFFLIVYLRLKYNVCGVISTGPGVSVIPIIMFKLFGVKTVAFESWSRFSKPSITGRILSKIVNIFYIQNKSISKAYKGSTYKGRL
ncbi:PssD/Cps14F family polysaccharide biosynthesis glycosyltransferase [Shewanella baltica]|uniref:PssD/Cps14F family polysaccharide biosynthesis glycosyltransferase n=1 Tax=Shewanella baltica TaxID=62322 RepID=UPI003D085A6F